MRYYAVIDTNVIVSSLLVNDSNPKKILDAIHIGIIIPLLNNQILSEYEEVLNRDKFHFRKELVDTELRFSRRKAFFLIRLKVTKHL